MPILMYHSISDNLFGKSHPYYQINTTPEVFTEQMRWLRHQGYRTLDTRELIAGLENREDLSKTVVITFDDGYRDFYTDAMDVLKQCGFTAEVFLTTGRIREIPTVHEGVEYLTWNEVRELRAEGIRFGSHTVTHPDLRSLGPEQIDYEIGYSKETIEDELGEPVQGFSYPFAYPEEDVAFREYMVDTLTNLGFDYGLTTMLGRANRGSGRMALPRLPINSEDDQRLFRAKLEGSYDWVHWPQRIYKTLHHHTSLMTRSGGAHLDRTNRDRSASLGARKNNLG